MSQFLGELLKGFKVEGHDDWVAGSSSTQWEK